MCCHEHPDNGHGLALERVGSVSSSPWTLEELRQQAKELVETTAFPEECSGDIEVFLDWLEEQND